MFKYEEGYIYERYSDSNKEFEKNIRLSENEDEMFEFIKINNPFVNRHLAKNINVTIDVMKELLTNHIAYTMCVIIACNKNINEEIKERLYEIAKNEYKDSMLLKDLDRIFLNKFNK